MEAAVRSFAWTGEGLAWTEATGISTCTWEDDRVVANGSVRAMRLKAVTANPITSRS
jgi:hypothetical protein